MQLSGARRQDWTTEVIELWDWFAYWDGQVLTLHARGDDFASPQAQGRSTVRGLRGVATASPQFPLDPQQRPAHPDLWSAPRHARGDGEHVEQDDPPDYDGQDRVRGAGWREGPGGRDAGRG